LDTGRKLAATSPSQCQRLPMETAIRPSQISLNHRRPTQSRMCDEFELYYDV
jgi:hypothetical protein